MRTHGTNSKLVRIHNRALILRLILRKAPISRKQIAVETHLTQATITKITADMIGQSLILENDDTLPNQGLGRKPIGLSIQRAKFRVLAVNIGRSAIQAALCDLSGKVLFRVDEVRNVFADSGSAIGSMVIDSLTQLVERSKVEFNDVLGIAIAAPGPIDARSEATDRPVGPFASANSAPFDWSRNPIVELVSRRFRLPVFADNVANVIALGECWFGSSAQFENFVVYTVGAGIGAGVIIDGMLLRGEDDVAAEIGHVTIDYQGKPCVCGNVGCLELYASFLKLVAFRRGQGSHPGAAETEIQAIEAVFADAARGEPLAARVIEETAAFLGIGAVSLANIFSPECIILAGNDTGASDLGILVPVLEKALRERSFPVISGKVKIAVSALGQDAPLLGGVALVLQDFFS